MCYRGGEKHEEKKEERQLERERDLWEEERPKLVTVRVWGEKSKGREKKWESLPQEKERRPYKITFPIAIDEDNIYIRYNVWERDCFPKKKNWKTTNKK